MTRPTGAVRRGAFTLALLTGCGVANAEGDRDQVLADTCLSTIIRAGLPAPDPEQISAERFAAERRRLLDEGARFNTVRPYRNVCNAIKKELREARSDESGSSPDDTTEDDQDVGFTDGTPPGTP